MDSSRSAKGRRAMESHVPPVRTLLFFVVIVFFFFVFLCFSYSTQRHTSVSFPV